MQCLREQFPIESPTMLDLIRSLVLLRFSFTTTKPRIQHIKPALDSVISQQTRKPDAIYLSIGPKVRDGVGYALGLSGMSRLVVSPPIPVIGQCLLPKVGVCCFTVCCCLFVG